MNIDNPSTGDGAPHEPWADHAVETAVDVVHIVGATAGLILARIALSGVTEVTTYAVQQGVATFLSGG